MSDLAQTRPKIGEIEGLRAISVLLVLIFHIDEQWLPAGYLGVDAFFAISGFVITRYLILEMAKNQLSLKTFYLNRVARIIPAMIATVILTVFAFSMVYGAGDFSDLTTSAWSSLLSISNVYFYFDSSYWAESSVYKPLLHTWSLAVEEQFYLVWPILILLLARFSWLTSSTLIVISSLGFAMALLVSIYDSDMAFYLSPFRAYQFAIGGAAALLGPITSRFSNKLPMSLVCGLWIFAVVALSFGNYIPGPSQISVQGLTSLLTASACFYFANGKGVRASSFPWSILERIGSNSYTIYLAHWPVILFFFAAIDETVFGALWFKIFLVGLSIAAGWMLSFFVEGVFRFSKNDQIVQQLYKVAAVFLLFFLSVFCLFGFANFSAGTAGNSQISFKLDSRDVLREELRMAVDVSRCDLSIKADAYKEILPTCFVADKPNVVIIGDSLTQGPAITLRAFYPQANFIRLVWAGCQVYLGSDAALIADIAAKSERCGSSAAGYPWPEIMTMLADLPLDALVVGGNWNAPAISTQTMLQSAEATQKLGVPVAFLGVRPWFKESSLRLAAEDIISPAKGLMDDYVPLRGHAADQVELNLDLGLHLPLLDHVQYIDIYRALCPNSCNAYWRGRLIWRDHSHLAHQGAMMLGASRVFDEFIGLVLQNSEMKR